MVYLCTCTVRTYVCTYARHIPILLQETELRLRGPTDHEDVSTYDILIIASDRVASVDDPGHTCQVGDNIYIHTIQPTLTQVTHAP